MWCEYKGVIYKMLEFIDGLLADTLNGMDELLILFKLININNFLFAKCKRLRQCNYCYRIRYIIDILK